MKKLIWFICLWLLAAPVFADSMAPVGAPNAANITGTLGAAHGGTGLTSPGTSGNVLTSNGSAWTSATPSSGPFGSSVKTITSGSGSSTAADGLIQWNGSGNYTLTLETNPTLGTKHAIIITSDPGSNILTVTTPGGYLIAGENSALSIGRNYYNTPNATIVIEYVTSKTPGGYGNWAITNSDIANGHYIPNGAGLYLGGSATTLNKYKIYSAEDASRNIQILDPGTTVQLGFVKPSANTADGVLYWQAGATNGGYAQTTAAGTAGQVLTSNGAGVAPTFQDAAGGGGSLTLQLDPSTLTAGEAYINGGAIRFSDNGAVTDAVPQVNGPARHTVSTMDDYQRGPCQASIFSYYLGIGPSNFTVPSLTYASDGNVWTGAITAVNKVTPQGVVSRFDAPDSGTAGITSVCALGTNVWATDIGNDKIVKFQVADGAATAYATTSTKPYWIVTDGTNLYGNFQNSSDHPEKIWKCTTSGTVTEYDPGFSTGYSDGGGAVFNAKDGNLYFTRAGGVVAKVSTSGTLLAEYTLTGTPDLGTLTVGLDGNLYLTDFNNNILIRLSTAGVQTNFANPGSGYFDFGPIVTGADGKIYFQDNGLLCWFDPSAQTFGNISTDIFANDAAIKCFISGPGRQLWYTDGGDGIIGCVGINNGAPDCPPSGTFIGAGTTAQRPSWDGAASYGLWDGALLRLNNHNNYIEVQSKLLDGTTVGPLFGLAKVGYTGTPLDVASKLIIPNINAGSEFAAGSGIHFNADTKQYVFTANTGHYSNAVRTGEKTGTGSALAGKATLSGGTVTVTTSAYTSTCVVVLTDLGGGTLANLGTPYVDTAGSTAGTSFVIKSTNAIDNNTVGWLILEP